MRVARIAALLFGVLIAGVGVGFWTAGLTDLSRCAGLCQLFVEHRFSAWQSVLLGVGASGAVLAVELAIAPDIRNVLARPVRWLHHDIGSAESRVG